MQPFKFIFVLLFFSKKNAEPDIIKMQVAEKLVAAQPISGTAEMNRCQSVS